MALRVLEGLCALFGVYMYWLYPELNCFAEFSFGVIVTDFLIWVFMTARNKEFDKKAVFIILAFIGQHSLEIYLLHLYFTSGLRFIIRELNIGIWYIPFITVSILEIVGPLLISDLLRRMNLWNLLFRPVSYIKF